MSGIDSVVMVRTHTMTNLAGKIRKAECMKKAVLLGDSIRQIGYGTKVPALLADEFTVWQPGDNCRFAAYTLRGMFDWRDNLDCDVIHWNNGLWDECSLFDDGSFTRLDDYVDTMSRIARILKTHANKVIFATTTPVTDQNPYNHNVTIRQFNAAIVPVLADMGVIINDLYSVCAADIDKYIRKDDNIHLTDAGIDVCAAQVADVIRKAAAELS